MASNLLLSPLARARLGVMVWIEMLPKDAQLEAGMAMESLMQMAEREIDQSYRDGAANRAAAARAQKMKEQESEARNKAQGE